MIYTLITRKSRYQVQLRDDLSARKYALALPIITRVETDTGRVVYRQVPETALRDFDMVAWFDRDRSAEA